LHPLPNPQSQKKLYEGRIVPTEFVQQSVLRKKESINQKLILTFINSNDVNYMSYLNTSLYRSHCGAAAHITWHREVVALG